MANPVVYFDIGCRDLDKTRDFYVNLFGWETSAINDLSARVLAGSEAGISGGITSLGHEPHNYVMVYVEVDDLEATIDKAVGLSGEPVIGPLPLPDGRRFAWVKDVEGTLFGLLGP